MRRAIKNRVSDRDVVIVFDSDAATNPEVRTAELKLAAYVESLGARVTIVRLPGHKVGLDDFLAAGHGEADLRGLARAAR
jgi:hypothetical protein